ncbi:hypothetical protein WJ971_21590 [Achromobacter xylosoxidans]
MMASIRVLVPPLRILAADTPLPLAVQEKAGWRRQAPWPWRNWGGAGRARASPFSCIPKTSR